MEIVEDGDDAAAFELELVVHARDGALAPPLIVDTPAVLDASDGAHGALEAHGNGHSRGVRLDGERAGRR